MRDERTYEVVLRGIESDLRSGALCLGDRLPGERALSDSYGISRASVRDALRILDVLGVVRASTGSGPKAGTILIAEPSAGLSSALRLHMASKHLPVEDVVQARILLETWAARESARRQVGVADYAEARRLLVEMEKPGLDEENFHLLDAQFHVALSSLAGNAVIATMMGSLREAIHGYVMESVSTMEDWNPVAIRLREQHLGILTAAESGDGDAAAERLAEHINWFHSLNR